MKGEKAEHTGQQHIHENGRGPQGRIVVAVMPIGVGLIADEAFGHAGVAFAAGSLKIHFRNRRFRIGGGPDVMESVAIPAMRGFNVAESRYLGMESIPIGFELFLMTSATGGAGLHLPRLCTRVSNLVRGMAVRADRRARISHPHALAMNTRLVILGWSRMALATCCGDVGAI